MLLYRADTFEIDRSTILPLLPVTEGMTISLRPDSTNISLLPAAKGLNSADDCSVTFVTSSMVCSLYCDNLKLDENELLSPMPPKPLLLLLPNGFGNDRRTRPVKVENVDSLLQGIMYEFVVHSVLRNESALCSVVKDSSHKLALRNDRISLTSFTRYSNFVHVFPYSMRCYYVGSVIC